ncbi:J domain-containing protein [Algivirga pacifica]|uniref:J domain-containing protein n=1 Tax=Algivirga pacifica TaxID=1162670 RepID=A0ABP9DIT4_9BACT
MQQNYYNILGVSSKATQQEIKRAYKTLVKHYHPDIYDGRDADDKMKLLNEAYGILGNSLKRHQYDQFCYGEGAQYAYTSPASTNYHTQYSSNTYQSEGFRATTIPSEKIPKRHYAFVLSAYLLFLSLVFWGGYQMQQYSANKYYEEAHAYYLEGDIPQALIKLAEVRKQDDTHVRANWLMGVILFREYSDEQQALTYLRAADRLSENTEDKFIILQTLAEVYTAQQRYDQVVTVLENIEQLNQVFDPLLTERIAWIYTFQLKEGGKALPYYSLLQERGVENTALTLGQGVAYWLAGQGDKAKDLLEKYRMYQPEDGQGAYYLGYYYLYNQKDTLQALEYWREANDKGLTEAAQLIQKFSNN